MRIVESTLCFITHTATHQPNSMAPPPRILVLDLGDVLFNYNALGLTEFPPKTFRAIVTSPEWAALERGEIDQDEALRRLSAHPRIHVPALKIEAGLAQCRKSLSVNLKLFRLLTQFKEKMKGVGGGLKIYAMTNISNFDYGLLRMELSAQGLDWGLFDGVFTSFQAGMRKPEARFYGHVIQQTGALPKDMVFVDDKAENVDAAAAAGIRGIVFKTPEKLIYQLHLMFLDPRVLGGRSWLKANARKLVNHIEGKVQFEDAFSQFLIMEATNDPSLLHLDSSLARQDETDEDIHSTIATARQWNYFLRKPVGTTQMFPNDVDTTACSILAFTPRTAINKLLDSMLDNRNADGVIQTYWDPTRPRIDCIVLCNVVRAFYKYKRGGDVQESLAFIANALRNKDYISGTRHYCTPETFLFFLARLVAGYPNQPELQALREPLAVALSERIGTYINTVTQNELDLEAASRAQIAFNADDGSGNEHYTAYVPEVDSLAIAERILACQLLNIRPDGFDEDILHLTEMQCEDGSWPLGWVCRYGRSKSRIGNHGVATAYAVNAIEAEVMNSAIKVDVTGLESNEKTGYKIGRPTAGPYVNEPSLLTNMVLGLMTWGNRDRSDSLMR